MPKNQAFPAFFKSLYHNLARFSTPENPDIFRVVQYIMLCEAGKKRGN
jgi:hypothetical protein